METLKIPEETPDWSKRQLKILVNHGETMSLERLSLLVGKSQHRIEAKLVSMGLREKKEPAKKSKIKRPPAIYSNKSFWNGTK